VTQQDLGLILRVVGLLVFFVLFTAPIWWPVWAVLTRALR